MGIAAIICFILALVAIGSGEIPVAVVFVVLGIWFACRWATKDEREKEKEQKEQKETVDRARERFKDSRFVTQIIQEFRNRNWRDLDYNFGGCKVWLDRIITPYQTYVYIDYGLGRLDVEGCKELAVYLGMAFGKDFCTKIDSDGEFASGYILYSSDTAPTPSSEGKKW